MALTKVTGQGLETLSDGVTITTADNTAQLTLTSTDTDANAGPHLKLYRNATGADSDALGQVEFTGKDDAGNDFIFAQIESYISDASNGAEAGYLEIFRGVGGTERVSGMVLSPTETVFNDNSGDIDFRVESNGNVNMLFVDGGNNAVGIGAVPNATFGSLLYAQGTPAVNKPIISGYSQGNSNKAGFALFNDAGNRGIWTDSNDLLFTTSYEGNSTVHMKIDGSGNVTVPVSGAAFNANGLALTTDDARILIEEADGTDIVFVGDLTGAGQGGIFCYNHGGTAVIQLNSYADSTIIGQGLLFTAQAASAITIASTASAAHVYTAYDFRKADGSSVGNIAVGTSSTAYNTSSDYRLKENVDYTWDATTRLKQLKPARFNFISDETNNLVDGFIAHEVSSVVPEAISGTKDEVDADDNPKYQGIDQSKLIPLLVKTIQELEARITALEG